MNLGGKMQHLQQIVLRKVSRPSRFRRVSAELRCRLKIASSRASSAFTRRRAWADCVVVAPTSRNPSEAPNPVPVQTVSAACAGAARTAAVITMKRRRFIMGGSRHARVAREAPTTPARGP